MEAQHVYRSATQVAYDYLRELRMFLTLHGHERDDALHRPLVEAIESGDPAKAEHAVRAHVIASVNGLVDFLKTNNVAQQR